MADFDTTERGAWLGKGLIREEVARVISNGTAAQARSEWIDLTGVLSVTVITSTEGATAFTGTVQMYGFNVVDKPADSAATATGASLESHTNTHDYSITPFVSSSTSCLPVWAQWRVTTFTTGAVNVDVKVMRLRNY